MKVIDPMPFLSIDSGLRKVALTTRERRTLEAAAEIVEKLHSLVVDRLGDEHYDHETSWCGVPADLRDLAREGFDL